MSGLPDESAASGSAISEELPTAPALQIQQNAAEGPNLHELYQRLIEIAAQSDEREQSELDALRNANDRLQAENQELRARVDEVAGRGQEEEEGKGKGKGKEIATSDDNDDDNVGLAAWQAYYHGSETGSSAGRGGLEILDDELSETLASFLARTEALVADNGQLKVELEQLRHKQQHAEEQKKALKTRVKELEALNELAEEVRLDKNQQIEELNKAAEKIRLDKKTIDCRYLVVLNRVKEAEVAKVAAKMEMEKLKLEIEGLKVEKEGFDKKMDMAHDRIKMSDEKIKSLEVSLSVLRKEDEYSRFHLESLQETINNQSAQIQGLQNALNQLHLQLQPSGASGAQSSGYRPYH